MRKILLVIAATILVSCATTEKVQEMERQRLETLKVVAKEMVAACKERPDSDGSVTEIGEVAHEFGKVMCMDKVASALKEISGRGAFDVMIANRKMTADITRTTVLGLPYLAGLFGWGPYDGGGGGDISYEQNVDVGGNVTMSNSGAGAMGGGEGSLLTSTQRRNMTFASINDVLGDNSVAASAWAKGANNQASGGINMADDVEKQSFCKDNPNVGLCFDDRDGGNDTSLF